MQKILDQTVPKVETLHHHLIHQGKFLIYKKVISQILFSARHFINQFSIIQSIQKTKFLDLPQKVRC